jgi:NhaA family Na+:H+ antiporter
VLQQLESSLSGEPSKQSTELQESAVRTIEHISEQAQAPLQRLEQKLHTMVAFVIMPVFAFANAGVAISPDSLNDETAPVMLGIIVGLTIGKPIGIFGASWLAVRAGIATLPLGSNWQHLLSAGVLAGIGFTMSIFIASLAFNSPVNLASAKLAILVASTVAGSAGIFLLSHASATKQS